MPIETDIGRKAWSLFFEFFQDERGRISAVCNKLGLTGAQGHLLRRLKPGTTIPMRGLAQVLGYDASNITGLVDKLEARGLVERRPDPTDRRVRMIAITEAGAALRDTLLENVFIPPPAIASLNDRDKQLLAEILSKVVRASHTKAETLHPVPLEPGK